ncbi:MAG: 16S rRNA (cytosine(967)-C(5))-methyltransferase [Proteobacteria bacterium]|nr:16S rRNA (cytosine(967)-C(5))-methyltransferase [Pseudomonadota bacterium]
MQSSQILAARVVQQVLRGTTLPVALSAVLDESDDALTPAVRGFVHELAYGTLRHWGTLRALFEILSVRPAGDPLLPPLVAVALYQLLHTRQPPFAVVDQAVQAAATAVHPAVKGFVNALLRRFLREKEALLAAVANDPVARYSYPAWWIARVQKEYPDTWQTLLDAGNARPPLTLRINRRQTTREAFLAALRAADIDATTVGDEGVIVESPQPVSELPGFDDGWFCVQDASAQRAALLLDARDGMRVLDACAAPGGKTTHILERASVSLLALDNDAARLARVEENLKRLRLDGAQAQSFSPRSPCPSPAVSGRGEAFPPSPPAPLPQGERGETNPRPSSTDTLPDQNRFGDRLFQKGAAHGASSQECAHANISQVVCLRADAAQPASWWDGQPFDRILADVPCSASGVVRRHPDVKWLRRPSDIAAFSRTQAALLDALWPLLATGGKLLYATCSLFRTENEDVVAAFCARHPEALHEVPTFAADVPHCGGQLLPSDTPAGHNQDGLYYAILHKRV